VQSVRKYRLAAERDGTAKDRRAFGSSYMTDAAIDEVVRGYANLETLSAACHGNVTDAGVARACQLKKLKVLYLAGDRITDAGLKPLSLLKQLTKLRLRSTLITDAGLQHLKGLTSLQRLYLTGTNVTDAGVKDLQAALPKCKIKR
jgi:Leucine-rich repeat (LRR) protein